MRTHLALVTMIALAAPLAAQQQGQPATDRGPRTTTEQQTTASQAEHNHAAPKAGEVAMIGCLMREADYRKLHDDGKGGVLGTGITAGNDYVLVGASPAPAVGTAASNQQARTGNERAAVGTSGAAKMDYRLSGKLEPDMATGVGRMVEVVGTVDKDAKPNETSKITASLWHPVGDFCPEGTLQK